MAPDYEEDNTSQVDAAIAAFTALSLDERDSLASTIGGAGRAENRIFPMPDQFGLDQGT